MAKDEIWGSTDFSAESSHSAVLLTNTRMFSSVEVKVTAARSWDKNAMPHPLSN